MKSWMILLAGIAAVCLLAVPSFAAPFLSGAWEITFFQEPNHSTGGTQCLEFIQTGTVMGEPRSGTWAMKSHASNIQGFWIQEGDQVKIWGKATAVNYYNIMVITGAMIKSNLMAGDFFSEYFWNSSSNYGGSWRATKVGIACTTALDNEGSRGTSATQ